MKNLIYLFLFFCGCMHAQQALKIGSNPYTINPTAALEVESTTKGFLPPRMTFSRRNAIATPAAGLVVYCTNCGQNGELQVYNGTSWVNVVGGASSTLFFNGLSYGVIISSGTGRTWLDRNLGASRVATSSTDTQAYGDYYQWGRNTDGHEKSNSTVTTTISSSSTPGHGNFISPLSGNVWLSSSVTNLWQGVNGINNPCPEGFRIPTLVEFQAESTSWGANTGLSHAYNLLKLTANGYRISNNTPTTSFSSVGNQGFYATSILLGTINTTSFGIYSSWVMAANYPLTHGVGVRCIMN